MMEKLASSDLFEELVQLFRERWKADTISGSEAIPQQSDWSRFWVGLQFENQKLLNVMWTDLKTSDAITAVMNVLETDKVCFRFLSSTYNLRMKMYIL